jgi:hypothetical protein
MNLPCSNCLAVVHLRNGIECACLEIAALVSLCRVAETYIGAATVSTIADSTAVTTIDIGCSR